MEAKQPHITELIIRCKNADKDAQMQLYRDYYRAMYNTSVRVLKDSFEAEDVMQEAFLTAFTKIDMFKGEVTFGAWLKKIVINKSLTQLKKNNRYREVKMEVIVPENTEETTEIDYTGIQPKRVLEALNSLRENYKIALTLHLIEGYDYEEMAEILNYTNENVRTTVSRAKKKLKQVLIADNLDIKTYERH